MKIYLNLKNKNLIIFIKYINILSIMKIIQLLILRN